MFYSMAALSINLQKWQHASFSTILGEMFVGLQFKTCGTSYQEFTDRLKVKIQGVNLWEPHDSIWILGGTIRYIIDYRIKYRFLVQYVEKGPLFSGSYSRMEPFTHVFSLINCKMKCKR